MTIKQQQQGHRIRDQQAPGKGINNNLQEGLQWQIIELVG